MNSHHKWIASLWLYFFSSILFAADTIHAKKTELNNITGQIQQLQKTIKQDQQTQQTLEIRLKNSEIIISQLSQDMSRFNASLTEEQTELNQLNNAQAKTQLKLNTQRQALTQQLRAAYQLGQSQALKILFNHQDPNALARHLTYYRYLTETRMKLIEEVHDILQERATNIRQINLHKQNLKGLLAQKQLQQQQQQKANDQREKLITNLNQNLKTKQEQIAMLMANQKALQQLISQLQTKLPSQSVVSGQPFGTLRSKLQWPIRGSIVAGFGSPIDQSDQRLTGVVIKAPAGTPVHAVYSGKVIFANWLRGFGLLVIVSHSNNYMSLYGRNQTLYAKVGDRVNTGDTIATIGNSGGFDKAGLYFEIRQNGTPVNPTAWCR